MSSRERWTVYPLLFLTLGIALKDKMTQVVDTRIANAQVMSSEQIFCRRLVITDQLGHGQVQIDSTPQGGVARFIGTRQGGTNVSLGHFSQNLSGLIITDANGHPLPGYVVQSPRPLDVPPPQGAPSDQAPTEPAPQNGPEDGAGEPQDEE